MPLPIATSTIVAQAWRFMELSPISSFDDDTEQARSAAEQYPNALRECLARADWSFASIVASLPEAIRPQTVAEDPDLPHFYQPPSGLVLLLEVGAPGTTWRLDRDGLRADTPAPLRIRYTGEITNESILPAAFQAAVALRLALLLGPRWLGTQSKLRILESQFDIELARAKKHDSRSASGQRYDNNTFASSNDWSQDATR
jgi:hypothetical protein